MSYCIRCVSPCDDTQDVCRDCRFGDAKRAAIGFLKSAFQMCVGLAIFGAIVEAAIWVHKGLYP